MSEIPTIAKSGRNRFHGYDYATEADIVEAVRKPMAARGVMMLTSVEQPIEWTEVETKGGKKEKLATIRVKFTFLDGDSNERYEFFGYGQGQDGGDKALYKALTGAEKYALLKTFLIPTGDDPERDDDEGRYAPPVQQGQRRAPPAQVARDARSNTPPETPKVVTSPPDPEAQKRAQETRSRIKRVLDRAMKLGTKKEELPMLIATILGEAKPSNTWTDDELARVEAAIAKAEREVGADVPF